MKKVAAIRKKTKSTGKADSFQELDVTAMVRGIGRKATDEELIHYLSKDTDGEPIDIETAFSKYSNGKC